MIIVLIRTQLRDDVDLAVYEALDAHMYALVQRISGFLSAKTYHSEDGDQISLIRFASLEALRVWKEHPEHREAQRRGREEFFSAYDIEICEVTRAYDFGRTVPDRSHDRSSVSSFAKGSSMNIEKPELGHLLTLEMTVHPIQDIGTTPYGHRRVFPVAEGSFTGVRLRGSVLPHAGSDWLLQRADGSFQQDVRVTLQTEDGALILMSYRGIRHSSPEVQARIARGEAVKKDEYYLRIAPFFETAAPEYDWLNRIVSVGVGERRPNGVLYEIFELL